MRENTIIIRPFPIKCSAEEACDSRGEAAKIIETHLPAYLEYLRKELTAQGLTVEFDHDYNISNGLWYVTQDWTQEIEDHIAYDIQGFWDWHN